MSRAEILKILKQFKGKYAQEYGIINLGLFGSTARDENQEASGVDVVSYRETMNAFLKSRIDRESLYV